MNLDMVSVTLLGGSAPNEGQVVLNLVHGIKATIHDISWDDLKAAVICRMLGYS